MQNRTEVRDVLARSKYEFMGWIPWEDRTKVSELCRYALHAGVSFEMLDYDGHCAIFWKSSALNEVDYGVPQIRITDIHYELVLTPLNCTAHCWRGFATVRKFIERGQRDMYFLPSEYARYLLWIRKAAQRAGCQIYIEPHTPIRLVQDDKGIPSTRFESVFTVRCEVVN